ncbi:MAG: hypothetical protein ISS16_02270 [Ignavibacteria bacterium]|nr:hypothetical protein [Ignavibacteria bacterium]
MYTVEKNGSKDTLISIGKGFFIEDKEDAMFITNLSTIAGAEKIFIEYGFERNVKNKEKLKIFQVYPLITTKKYYWYDEPRNLIIFKIPDLKPEHTLSLFDGNIYQYEEELFLLTCDSISEISEYEIESFIRDTFINWITIKPQESECLYSGDPVFDKEGLVLGIMEVHIVNNQAQIFVIPSKFINFIIDDIKLSHGFAIVEKKVDDFLMTPEIYLKLIPYDNDKFGKLFKE